MANTTAIQVNGVCDATLVDKTCTNSEFAIRVQFLDSGGSVLTLDSNPTLVITSARTETVKLSAVTMSGPDGMGRYTYTLNINDWAEGMYRFVATGKVSGVDHRLESAFNVYAPSRQQQIVFLVKNRLNDLEQQLYKLDLPVPKWSEDQILQEVENGLVELNVMPPMPDANYTFATAPTPYIVQYAFAQCLLSASILENWNTYTMSDGSANLNINRAQFLQSLGQQALKRFDDVAVAWKKSLRPGVRGMGSSSFPLGIRRAIGFLPNMKQVFGP